MRKMLQILLRITPLLTAVTAGVLCYFYIPIPKTAWISGVPYVLTFMAVLWVGSYQVKGAIDGTADRIKSTKHNFINLRRWLRNTQMRRAVIRFYLTSMVALSYVAVSLLLNSSWVAAHLAIITSAVVGIAAGVVIDSVLFFGLMRLTLSKIKERIDIENEQDQARLKLIEDLKKARIEHPIEPDDHLRSYIVVERKTA